MALTKCPECGNTISDKAEKCPHCGCPLGAANTAPTEAPQPPLQPTGEQSTGAAIAAKRKPVGKIGLVLLVVVLAVVLGLLAWKNAAPTVKDISITKWKLTDQSKYSDTYTATVTSETKKPFVALIGYYASENTELDDGTSMAPMPDFVYMDGGEGQLEVTEYDDDDPSLKRVPIGYLSCKTISEKDVKQMSCTVTDYSDYSDSTEADVDFEIELKSKESGILIFDIENDMTKGVETDYQVTIIDGKGSGTFYLWDLPVKSRGVEATLKPKAFCKAQKVKDGDYTVEKEFSIEKTDGKYYTQYNGNMQLRIADVCENGVLLFTTELTEGGNAGKRGNVSNLRTVIYNHVASISTYDSCDADETMITPVYDINIMAYLPFKEIEK